MEVEGTELCWPGFCLLVSNYLKRLPSYLHNNRAKWFLLSGPKARQTFVTYYYDRFLISNCSAICAYRSVMAHNAHLSYGASSLGDSSGDYHIPGSYRSPSQEA